MHCKILPFDVPVVPAAVAAAAANAAAAVATATAPLPSVADVSSPTASFPSPGCYLPTELAARLHSPHLCNKCLAIVDIGTYRNYSAKQM